MTSTEKLSYPIGRYDFAAPVDDRQREDAIEDLADLPRALAAAVDGLTDAQLDTPYRPGGWTVRQLVHHVADSHLNGYMRLKWALTEDEPTIKPYDQDRWVDLPDASLPIDVALRLLDSVHRRWDEIWRSLDPSQLDRAFLHPEYGRIVVQKMADWYAWHARHHVAHVTALRQRESW